MSSLIRRDDADRAAPLTPWRPQGAFGSLPAPLDPEILAREERITFLETRLAEMQQENRAALTRAHAEGAKEAAAAFASNEVQALALLEANVAAATHALTDALAALDRLAPLMCETALSAVFDDVSLYQRQVATAIDLQIRALNCESVIAISVSAGDFGDDAALGSLTSKYKRIAIATDASMPRGSCRIALRLGSIDIDLPAHWRALQRRLAEMAGTI